VYTCVIKSPSNDISMKTKSWEPGGKFLKDDLVEVQGIHLTTKAIIKLVESD
jgi:hypothetical protein